MTTRHTPGPWVADGRRDDDGAWYVRAPSGVVAELDGRDAVANGRLIAAAPEMLAALEAVLGDDHDCVSAAPAYCLECSAARAAVAKARGR